MTGNPSLLDPLMLLDQCERSRRVVGIGDVVPIVNGFGKLAEDGHPDPASHASLIEVSRRGASEVVAGQARNTRALAGSLERVINALNLLALAMKYPLDDGAGLPLQQLGIVPAPVDEPRQHRRRAATSSANGRTGVGYVVTREGGPSWAARFPLRPAPR